MKNSPCLTTTKPGNACATSPSKTALTDAFEPVRIPTSRSSTVTPRSTVLRPNALIIFPCATGQGRRPRFDLKSAERRVASGVLFNTLEPVFSSIFFSASTTVVPERFASASASLRRRSSSNRFAAATSRAMAVRIAASSRFFLLLLACQLTLETSLFAH
ncbi:hypothetical protein [Sphingobacterium populi]|uniref:hypothetical protein n=1 Tax=Sphingobacterium sp. CFCC 11742 TaxID=1775560 RepID=UPI001E39B66C|nr:hypothetical protein [Sphingobacterium sp. CFCC 11742]